MPEDPLSFKERFYRSLMCRPGLKGFRVAHRETDLYVQARRDVTARVSRWIIQARTYIESYAASHPGFLDALAPLPVDPFAPPVVSSMLEAGTRAGVGPMAAVAGAVAQYVGDRILEEVPGEVIVENGGDIFLKVEGPVVVSIFAGASPLSNRVGIRVPCRGEPLGICTSSGTVGHSRSLGRADAVTVVAASTPLADALATSAANLVKKRGDIDLALRRLQGIKEIKGAVVIKGGRLGVFGGVELVPIDTRRAGP